MIFAPSHFEVAEWAECIYKLENHHFDRGIKPQQQPERLTYQSSDGCYRQAARSSTQERCILPFAVVRLVSA